MSLNIAIDTAIKRGANATMIARALGVSVRSVQIRMEHIAHMARTRSEAATRRNIARAQAKPDTRPKSEPDHVIEERQARGMEAWLALPIRYENANEPRWNAGAAAANTSAIMRRVEHTRTLGGVVSYGNKEAA